MTCGGLEPCPVDDLAFGTLQDTLSECTLVSGGASCFGFAFEDFAGFEAFEAFGAVEAFGAFVGFESFSDE